MNHFFTSCRLLSFALLVFLFQFSYGANETIGSGSFIVNMGLTPQTVGNGLKPYGMVYDLIKNYVVPVKVVINPSKAKDGVDFTYNSVQYKGGTFIIAAQFITPAVITAISGWQSQGVVGVYTTTSFLVDVTQTYTSVPKWVLDAANGRIAVPWFANAGIPSSAYIFKDPALLGPCEDVYVMPHADPTWAAHSNLYTWNLTWRGSIWGGCHAVSVLENMFNPANSSQRTNFLSTNGLVPFGSHSGGTPPYTHQLPTLEPYQYMGIDDAAHLNGSEQIFMPAIGSAWRPTTFVGSYDPTQANVPSSSPGPAAVNLYGRAFGDSNRGWVCYQSGHNIGGTNPANVEAQRIFFNWSFLTLQDKKTEVALSNVPTQVAAGITYNGLTATATGGYGGYTYDWSSTCGGTFSDSTASVTSFTAALTGSCAIKCLVTDICGRKIFETEIVTVGPAASPPVAVGDIDSIPSSCAQLVQSTTLNVLNNDSDPNNDPMTLTGLSNTTGGTWSFTAGGDVTFSPANDFSGAATATYTVCDPGPLCSTGSVTIYVGTPDSKGCFPGSAWDVALTDSALAQTNTNVTNPNNALNDPDYDELDNATYAVIDNNADILNLDFGSVIASADSFVVFYTTNTNASSVTVTVSYSTNGSTYTAAGTSSFSDISETGEARFKVPVGGVRYVRVVRSAGTASVRVDGAQAEYYACISAFPVANSDDVVVKEDLPDIIDVTGNDDNPGNLSLTLTITQQPAHGYASVNTDGTITYVNQTDFSGTDSFQYQICNTFNLCSSATVRITIEDDGCTAGNYRPLDPTLNSVTLTGTAQTDDAEIRRNNPTNLYGTTTTMQIGKKPNNTKRAVMRFDLSSIPAGAVIQSAKMLLTQTGGDNGITISYSVHQLTQSFVENQVSWNNRSTGTAWTTAGGTYNSSSAFTGTFTRGANGKVDTFSVPSLVQQWVSGATNNGMLIKQTIETKLDKRITYGASENGTVSNRPRMAVTYKGLLPCASIPNRAPMAQPDVANTSSSQAVTIPVLSNDADPDAGNTLSVSIIGSVANGSALVSGSDIIFTPTASFNGVTSFQYKVCDNIGLCDTATVSVTVTNSAPVATNDSASTNSNTPVTIAVQANDTDPDGPAPMNNSILTDANNGSAAVSGSDIIYTPASNFTGPDSFYYVVCEGFGGCFSPLCDTALVKVTVNNLPPVAVNDSYTTNPCLGLIFDPTLNDTDPESGSLTAQVLSQPTNGTLVVSTTGFEYTPNPFFSGSDAFTYQVCDNGNPQLCSNPATVTINVPAVPANNAPVAGNDEDSTVQNQNLYLDVLLNDSDPDQDQISISLPAGILSPQHGTISVFNGTLILYTPDNFYEGADTFEYVICDVQGTPSPGCPAAQSKCDTAAVYVRVNNNNVNDLPVAVDDANSTTEETPVSGDVSTNDSDIDGPGVNITLVSGSSNGTILLNTDGTYTYTPDTDFNGNDTVTYSYCDGGTPDLCDTAILVIIVTPVNDAPVAVDDANTTPEDTPVSGDVSTNDSDVDGPGVNITVASGPSNGTILLNTDGTYTYTPDTDFNGNDTVTYSYCDGGTPDLCDTAILVITVTPLNDAPVAVDDANTTPEDTPVSGDVSTNDSDVDGSGVNITLVSGPSNGTILLNTDGTYTYTPDTDFNGNDTVTYSYCDGGTPDLCDTAILVITVTPVNDAPVAVDDANTTPEDTPVSGDVSTNDSDIDGPGVNITVVSGPSNGTILLNTDGTYTYTPDTDFNGNDTVTYSYCDGGTPDLCDTAILVITVTPLNDAPVAVDDANTTPEDTPVSGDVSTNDSDVDGPGVNITVVSGPSNGTILLNTDGTYTYTPDTDFNGNDTVTYSYCDGGTPDLCDTAILVIIVTPVNDAPVAVDDANTTPEDTPVSGDVSTNDSDVDGPGVNITVASGPSNGTILLNTDGTYTYTPDTDFNGNDTVTYSYCDGGTPDLCDTAILVITVTPLNDAPVAVDDANTTPEDTPVSGDVSTNDSDVDGSGVNITLVSGPSNGTILLNTDGTYTYTPDTDFNGNDTVTYSYCDGGTPDLCDTAILVITVTPVNDAPVAVDDANTTPEDTPVSGDVSTNDSDIDGPGVNITVVSGPSNGTILLNTDGTYTYTPDTDFNGNDTVTYSYCDGGTPDLCDTAILVITVTPLNDAPVAVDDANTTPEDTPVSGDVSTNDSDVDGPGVNITVVSGPSNGTILLNTDGTYTYTPNTDFNGNDTVTYSYCDGGSPDLCDTAILVIAVGPVNNAPVALDDANTTLEDTQVSGDVSSNDSDIDGPGVNITVAGGPSNGTIILNTDGTYTYTPAPDFNGNDTVLYSYCDGGTPDLCDTAILVITVTPVNDAPIAVDDANTTTEDTPVGGDVSTNDSDVDGAGVNITVISGPSNGTILLNTDGTYTYTPNTDFNGNDTVTYSYCDGGSPDLCDTAILVITVNPVNDAPVAVDDANTTPEDTPVSGDVSSNDSDIDGPGVDITLVSGPSNGTILLNLDGTYTYTPAPDFNGNDTVTYSYCDGGTPDLCDTSILVITVTPLNDAPVAVDDANTTPEDTPVSGDVSTNDSDLDGSGIDITLVSGPSNGTITLNPDGTYTYTPSPDFNGNDTVTYSYCDGGIPDLCDTAILVITVTPVNDAPVAVDDANTTPEDTPVSGDVSTNDSDIDGPGVDITLVSGPSNGTIVLNGDGTYTYTPDPGYNGNDTVVYSYCDGGTPDLCDTAILVITTTPANDPPTITQPPIVLPEDSMITFCPVISDPDAGDVLTISICGGPYNGAAILTGNCITYTPSPNFNGSDSICIIVCDNGSPVLCDTIMVPVTVTPVNDAPVAVDDVNTTTEDTPVSGDVSTNDSDIDGPGVNITVVSGPSNGTIVLNGDGTYTYTPDPGYNGNDTVVYSYCDGGTPDLCDTAILVITTTPANDPPTITQPPIVLPEDSMITFCPVISDPDAADVLTISICGGPYNGIVTLSGNCITYTPNLNFNGSDSICIIVCDNGSPVLCDTIMVPVTVSPVNDAPVAVDDVNTTTEDTPVSGDVSTNDSDVDGPGENITVVSGPLHGTIVLNADGTYTYTPDPGYNGNDTVVYSYCDGGTPNLCDTAILVITTTPANDPPTITQPPIVLPEDSMITFCPVISDPDAGDVLTISICGGPYNGAATLTGNCITYTPSPNFNGSDSICIIVCDNGSPVLCDTIMVPVTVTPVNDAPVAVDDVNTTTEDTPVSGDVSTNDSDIDGPGVNITVVSGPSNGTIVLNGDGTYTYTPDPGYNGNDTVVYSYCDGGTPDLCDTAILVITTTPANDPPTITQPPIVLPEDSMITFCPVISDPDAADVLTISICGGPYNGTVTLSGNCITYTPNANFNGSDSICIIVCDNGSPVLCDTIMVPVTVTPVNDVPVAVDDVNTTTEDTPVSGDVSTNDSDIDGPGVNITVVSGPSNGTIVLNADGTYTYTPDPGYNGNDTVVYSYCDGGTPDLCDTAILVITTTPANDPPTITQPPIVLPEDSMIIFCPVISDPDAADVLTISICGGPYNGAATLTGNCITYTPNPNFNGSDSICIIVCDNGSPVLCDTIMVPVTVTPVNDAPVAVDDATTTPEDTPVSGDVSTNDSDIDGPGVNITIVNGPSTGTIVLNGDGTYTYTPDPGYNGNDTVVYSYCDGGTPDLCDTAILVITTTPANDPPTITQPPIVLPEDSVITFCPVISDSDAGDVLTISICGGPYNGTVTLSGNCITYTPNANFNGSDSICIIVCDNGSPVLCDTIMVPVTVTPVNDAPVAVDDVNTTTEDTPVSGDVSTNDSDIDGPGVNITAVSGPSNGTIVLNGDGTYTYTPDPGYNGNDTVVYSYCDGGTPDLCDTAILVITTTPANDPPTISQPPIVLPEDSMIIFCPVISDPDAADVLTISICGGPYNGTVTLNGNCITYTPNPNFNGSDSICIIVCDNGSPVLCDTIMVPVTVSPVNDAPVAVDDATTTPEDTPVSGDVSTNDSDIDGPGENITVVSGPSHGTIVLNADGTYTYTPDPGYNGNDTVVYSYCDGGTPNLCDTAILVITTTPANDPPVITQPPLVLPEDSMITFCPVISDPDAGSVLTITICGGPFHGTVTLNGNCITYTPNPNYNGSDTICIIVCDNGSPVLCDTVIVPITVTPVNDKPIAIDDFATTPENTPVNIAVKNNDTDIEGPLTGNPVILDQPDHGTVVVNSDGTVTYTPTPGYVGNDTFTYIICDGGNPNLCDTATVIITITNVNSPPIANNDTITTPEDNSVNINVLANDFDPNGNLDPVPTIITDPSHGTVVVNADGSITYTPDPDYNGTDSFTYVICDSLGLCDTAVVYILVTPVEDLCYWLKGISPNGDGQNDAFWVNCNDQFPKATINIFNRWGDEVFRSNGHYKNDWYGRNQVEKDLPDGTYYYVYEFNDGIHKAHAGFITINR